MRPCLDFKIMMIIIKMIMIIIKSKLGVVVLPCNPRKQWQEEPCAFEARLVYTASSRPARAMQ